MKRKGMNLKFVVVCMLIVALLCGLGTMAFAETRTADGKVSEKEVEETVKVEEKDTAEKKEEKKTEEVKDEDEKTDFAELIADIPTVQAFTDEKVDEDDIDAILMAGYNSPSSMNNQPWHFSAITDASVLEELESAMSFGKPEDEKTNEKSDLPDDIKESEDFEDFDDMDMPECMDRPDDFPDFDEDYMDMGMGMPPMQGGRPDFGVYDDEYEFDKFELSDKEVKTEKEDKSEKDASSDDVESEKDVSSDDDAKSEKNDLPEKEDKSEKEKYDDKSADVPNMPSDASAKAGIGDAPLVIVVSCKDDSELDAGIAVQNMSVEAQLLGYGTKIISSPTIALNGDNQDEYRELLGIPEDMEAVCVLLVGKADTEQYDAETSATIRNPLDELVTIIK